MTTSLGEPGSAAPVILINALNRREAVHVQDSEGKILPLDKTSPPVLLQSHSLEVGEQWAVSTGRKKDTVDISLGFYPTVTELGILHCPPQIEGTVYLVDDEVLVQFPQREDFVTPALWRYLRDKNDEGKKGKRAKKEKRQHRSARRSILVLSGVTRSPWAAAGPDTVLITEIMWQPAETNDDEVSLESEKETT